jgi:hypothetical protein
MVVVALAALALAAPNLNDVLLKPAQVGKGYNVYARTDGFGVKGAPTLDLCGRKGYASEKLRVGRLQVNYLKANTTLGLSNEIVRYKPGGAQQAMREVAQHAATCPSKAIITGQSGVGPVRFTITKVRDAKLVKGYVAVRVHAVGKLTSGKKVDDISYAIYQRVGDMLSGVYSFGPDTPAQRQFALHAAEQSATLLRKLQAPKASGPPA